jgi:hypothetical protein
VGGTVTIENNVTSDNKIAVGTHVCVKIPLTNIDIKKESHVY